MNMKIDDDANSLCTSLRTPALPMPLLSTPSSISFRHSQNGQEEPQSRRPCRIRRRSSHARESPRPSELLPAENASRCWSPGFLSVDSPAGRWSRWGQSAHARGGYRRRGNTDDRWDSLQFSSCQQLPVNILKEYFWSIWIQSNNMWRQYKNGWKFLSLDTKPKYQL